MPKALLPLSIGISLGATSAQAAALPQQALGKTITFTYTHSLPTRFPSGIVKTTSKTEARTIYISSAGRMFMRNDRRNSGRESETVEQGPERTSGSLLYANGTIVGAVALASGAYQFTITFDPSFQSCSAKMLFGRSDSQKVYRWKGIGGQMLEAAGKGSISTSCSIASGNAL